MTDNELLEELRGWIRKRPPFGFSYDTSGYFVEVQASVDYEQWKRLSQYKPHPMEQGYLRIKTMKFAAEGIYKTIEDEAPLCLLSENSYLRKYAELILRGADV